MLTICDDTHRGRLPLNRRQMLSIGGLGLGGLSFSSLLTKGAFAAGRNSPLRGKSVIFLFQQGGPSQLETFDPKTTAPSGIRTVTDVVATAVPGVFFGETMSQLARRADKFTVVRSFQTNNAGHNIQPVVGPDSRETNIGVHYARVAGSTHPQTAMPTNTVLFPAAVCDDVPGPSARGNLSSTGEYGSAYAPFVPGGRGQLQSDMTLNLPRERFFHDRRALLKQLDRLHRRVEATAEFQAVDALREQAYRLLFSGGVAKALDLSREKVETRARYDTARYAGKGRWNKVARGRRGYYDAQEKSIGRLLLLARRLCEAGCGFVTIHAGYAGVWDMHADSNNLNMIDGMEAVGRSFDHAVSAFIDDVESRGLADKILLVCTGEMGRTPRINKRGGRDHWARLAPLLLYGSGIPRGMVLGRSNRLGGEPSSEPLTPKHLIATILQTLFDAGQLRVTAGVPRTVQQLTDHPPLPLTG